MAVGLIQVYRSEVRKPQKNLKEVWRHIHVLCWEVGFSTRPTTIPSSNAGTCYLNQDVRASRIDPIPQTHALNLEPETPKPSRHIEEALRLNRNTQDASPLKSVDRLSQGITRVARVYIVVL